MTDALRFLQGWYSAHCDGDWEHENRVRISTLDNPGWRLWINLADTELEGRTLPRARVERSGSDWLDYRSDGQVFDAACGPESLVPALEAFRAFAVADGAADARSS